MKNSATFAFFLILLLAGGAAVNAQDHSMQFDGTAFRYLYADNDFWNISNNFTMELWVNPTAQQENDWESPDNRYGGLWGQRYAIYPQWMHDWDHPNAHAGAGISVGTNGVSVYEHSDNYIPPLLVWSGTVSGCTHIAVVYQEKIPSLYVNGQLVKTGQTGTRDNVHPSAAFFGAPIYGAYAGRMDEVRIWDLPLTAEQIAERMKKKIDATDPLWNHCVLYLPFAEGTGATTQDISKNARQYSLVNGPVWNAGMFSLSVAADPSVPVNPGGQPNTIYKGFGPQSVTLTASGGTSYTWSPAEGLSCTDCASPIASPAATTTYTVSDQGGCAMGTFTLNVVDVRCPDDPDKVVMCHQCQGAHTICIGVSSVQPHLNHGDYLGECAGAPPEKSGSPDLPLELSLEQNCPNPFRSSTSISFALPADAAVRLRVYDTHGRLVAKLIDGAMSAGRHAVAFDSSNLPAGVYLCRLDAGGKSMTRAMTLMR